MKDFKFWAVIPAAGSGTRMGGTINKQLIDIRGLPVLARTLLVFENSPDINTIIVSCEKNLIEEIKKLVGKYKISKLQEVIPGGSTRRESVKLALEHIDCNFPEDSMGDCAEKTFAIIHDGARPFLSDASLKKSIDGAIKYKSCILGVPVKDTIKVTDKDNKVVSTLSRTNLWSIQTPQVFLLKDILAVHRDSEKLEQNILDTFTDDASMMEYFGKDVHIIPGDYTNIKITTPEDILIGENILRNFPEKNYEKFL